MIIVKYYLYTASRKEEEFYFDAFLAVLANKIKIKKQKSKSQINIYVRKPPIVTNALHESNVRQQIVNNAGFVSFVTLIL